MSYTELLQPDNYYHIYNHANGSDNIFKQEENYYYFLEKYVKYIVPIADTFAYCLMPNHFHLFIRVKPEQSIMQHIENIRAANTFEVFKTSKVMSSKAHQPDQIVSRQFSNFFNGYTKAYNLRFNFKGSLFNPRFKRKKVETTDYFIQLVKYIHLNPVTHGFVKDITDWKFSSYHSYILNKPSKINRDEALQWFGDINNFTYLHKTPVNEKLILDLQGFL